MLYFSSYSAEDSLFTYQEKYFNLQKREWKLVKTFHTEATVWLVNSNEGFFNFFNKKREQLFNKTFGSVQVSFVIHEMLEWANF
jgi:hypothetical protein